MWHEEPLAQLSRLRQPRGLHQQRMTEFQPHDDFSEHKVKVSKWQPAASLADIGPGLHVMRIGRMRLMKSP